MWMRIGVLCCWWVASLAAADGVKDLERALGEGLKGVAGVEWRVPFRVGGAMRFWSTRKLVLLENSKRELWAIEPSSGKIAFSFSIDPNEDKPKRRVAWVADSENHVHVLCSDGVLYTLDRVGNLEYMCRLGFGATSGLAATDRFVLAGGGRFLYCWDVVNNRYAKRRRFDGEVVAGPAKDANRWFAAGDGQV